MERNQHPTPTTPLLPTSEFASGDLIASPELFELLPYGLLVHDDLGRILRVNQQFADLLGFSTAELLTRNVHSLIHPDELERRMVETVRLATGLADGLLAQHRMTHSDGRTVRVRAKHLPLTGRQPLVLIFVQDWAIEHQIVVELAWAAYHDGLTGLFNRAGLITHLEQLQLAEQPAAVALIDLNGFKAINDSHGHSGGDDYLRAVADRLTSAITGLAEIAGGQRCLAARLAGDEFVVVVTPLAAGTEADPMMLEKFIRQALEGPISITDSVSGHQVSLVVSAAVGAVGRQLWMSPEQVLDWADRMMYAEKRHMRERRS